MHDARLRKILPILMIAIAAAIPLWKAVLLGQWIGPFNQIAPMIDAGAPKPSQPWDVLQADGVLQSYAWRVEDFRYWSTFHPPFWNRYELAGTPLLANSQSEALYPPVVILGILRVPPGPAGTLLAFLHLFLAGWGLYALSKRLGAGTVAALIGGLSFSLGAFMLSWTALQSVVATVCWIPWLLRWTYEIASGKTHRPSAALAAMSLVAALMLLAGHLQFAAYGFMGAILFGFSIAFSGPRRLGPKAVCFGLVLLGSALGAGLAAPQLLPALRFSHFSHRRSPPTSAGYAAYSASALKPFELANLPDPTFEGSPRVGVRIQGLKLQSYWPMLAKRGESFAEAAVGLSPLLLALLCFAPWRDRRAWSIGIVALVGILLAVGSSLDRILYFWFPGWSATGSPNRAVCLFLIAASCLAALGAERWMRAPGELGKIGRYSPLIPLIVSAPFLLLAKAFPSLAGSLGATIDALAARAVAAALPGFAISIVLSSAALWALKSGTAWARTAVAAPVLLMAAWGGLAIVSTGRPLPTPSVPALHGGRVAIVNDDWSLYSRKNALMPPDMALVFGFPELGGYDSLIHRDSYALVKTIDGRDPAPEANGNMVFVKSGFSQRLAADAGVTDVWSRKPILGLDQDWNSDGFFGYALKGPGLVATSAGPPIRWRWNGNQIVVEAGGPATVVVRDRMMPGWSATVDGKAALMQNSIWKVLQIPAGVHKIEMTYVPDGYALGLALAGCAGAALILLVATEWVKIKRSDEA